ncbi:MAG: hypothetical protein J6J97_10285 [Akkermansia sp.]|nr:hypothetical protein [Akkermansia sp.]
MRRLLPVMMMLAMAPATMAQGDLASRFYDDRMAEFSAYLDAREKTARNAAEKKSVAAERKAFKRRIEAARMGYTGLTPQEQAFWDSLKAELTSVLNLWQQSAEADEGEKQAIQAAALMALAAAQKSYVAQMRFAMAQLGMAACVLDADTVKECTHHFRIELQREYRQDFHSFLYAVPWGLEDEEEAEEQHQTAPAHGSEEAEEGTVDLIAGGADSPVVDAPETPLMVHELAHETGITDAARSAAAGRAGKLWLGYLNLCSEQINECFGTERGSALVSGVPLPGAVEMSFYSAVQEQSKQLFAKAEEAWQAYVEAMVAAHDPGWQASEGAMAHTDVSAEAQMLRFPLYATHEQYLAFILAPHLQYAEPDPMPETDMVE